MVAKRKLTTETLSKLGRRKLAELLIAEAAGNRRLTQTLNLAISADARRTPQPLYDARQASKEGHDDCGGRAR
jgi:hypothetical protein